MKTVFNDYCNQIYPSVLIVLGFNIPTSNKAQNIWQQLDLWNIIIQAWRTNAVNVQPLNTLVDTEGNQVQSLHFVKTFVNMNMNEDKEVTSNDKNTTV